MRNEIWMPILVQVPSVVLYGLGAAALTGWGPKGVAAARVVGFMLASLLLAAAVVFDADLDVTLLIAFIIAARPVGTAVASFLALTQRTVPRMLAAAAGGLGLLCAIGGLAAFVTVLFEWRTLSESTSDALIYGGAAAMLVAYALEALVGVLWLVGGLLERRATSPNSLALP